MTDIIHAPWTVEQVCNAEAWQRCSTFHPYTCGNRERAGHPFEETYGDHGVLCPTIEGWVCPYCGYTQDWAHDFTLNSDPPGSIFDSHNQTGDSQ